jgi:hypothetical protein
MREDAGNSERRDGDLVCSRCAFGNAPYPDFRNQGSDIDSHRGMRSREVASCPPSSRDDQKTETRDLRANFYLVLTEHMVR